jgi:predicted PhzF superfamily epimerase YddE/YHI9
MRDSLSSAPDGQAEKIHIGSACRLPGALRITKDGLRRFVAPRASARREGTRELTRRHGHESTFVFPPTDPGEADFRFRFFVPRQADLVFDARQFPKASGFPEGVATGVGATALAFGLVAYGLIPCDGKRLTVRQGRAMGLPSEIFVRLDLPEGGSRPQGCFLGGRAVLTGGPR